MTMPDHVCTGQTNRYYIIPSADTGSTFTWWINGEIMTGINSGEFIYTWNSPGTYLLEVQERSSDGCNGPKLSGIVLANPKPVIRISVSDTLINNGNRLTISVQDPGDLTWGKWIYDLTVEPDRGIIGNSTSGTFTSPTELNEVLFTYDRKIHKVVYRFVPVIVNDEGVRRCEGEEVKITVWIYPGSANGEVFVEIPDAFSPNGDGINDEWKIKNIEFYPDAEVTVYNRWGQLVWQSGKGYPVPWDGRSKGKDASVDSYHYYIELHNGKRAIIGNVTVVR